MNARACDSADANHGGTETRLEALGLQAASPWLIHFPAVGLSPTRVSGPRVALQVVACDFAEGVGGVLAGEAVHLDEDAGEEVERLLEQLALRRLPLRRVGDERLEGGERVDRLLDGDGGRQRVPLDVELDGAPLGQAPQERRRAALLRDGRRRPLAVRHVFAALVLVREAPEVRALHVRVEPAVAPAVVLLDL